MEDPEEWNVPSLSLFRVSLDDYPSHRPPGGRGGPVGPREQAGTAMPLLGPYHLGPGDPRLAAQRGRGSGSPGPGGPRGRALEPGAHAQALIHPGARAHDEPSATGHTGEEGNGTLRAEAVGRLMARITKGRGPRRQCGAGSPSLSASSGPEASSGPGVRPSVLPSTPRWSSLLCCFCRRVSLYLRVMSLRAAGARHHRPARSAEELKAWGGRQDTRGRGAHRRKKRQTVQVRASTEPSVQHWAM